MGQPVYYGTQRDWVFEEMSLNDFLGQNILIKIVLISDGFQQFDGFYFDDFKIEVIPNTTAISKILSSKVFLSPAVPNPSTSQSVVSYSNAISGSYLVVYNIFGQLTGRFMIKESTGKIIIPVSNYSEGVYTYFIQSADKSVSQIMKLVVNK